MMAIGYIISVAVILTLTTQAVAQIRYKDDEGVMHWVNTLDEVPPKYRSGATGNPSTGRAPVLGPSDPKYWEQKNQDNARQRAAQEQERKKQEAAEANAAALRQANDKWTRDIDGCTEETRRSGVFGATRFDAYVSDALQVQMIGSSQARFYFQKCMTELGHTLKSPSP